MIFDDYSIIIAIDPGLSGGIAYKKGDKYEAVKMPRDPKEMQRFFNEITGLKRALCFIEMVNMRPEDLQGGKAFGIQKMLKNYNQTLAILSACNIGYIQVVPRKWQNDLNLTGKKGETKTVRKNRFKRFAKHHFKNKKITLQTADAYVILYWALFKMKYEPEYIRDRIPLEDLDILF
jgi:hypothetical protein